MKIKDFLFTDAVRWLVVLKRRWLTYKFNAKIDRVCYDYNEALAVKNSIERCDSLSCVIIVVKNGKLEIHK